MEGGGADMKKTIRDAAHEGVSSLLKNPDEEIITLWWPPEGTPEFCVTIRNVDPSWQAVVFLPPPGERVMWMDEKELMGIVAMEKSRLGRVGE